jgi:probable HAF family extracellular repeat protein
MTKQSFCLCVALVAGNVAHAASFEFQALALPTGAVSARATGINDAGDVVGYATSADDSVRPVLWRAGQPVDFLSSIGSPVGHATAISNNGVIVGFVGSSNPIAFVWRDGQVSYPAGDGTSPSNVTAVSPHGQFAGGMTIGGNTRPAVSQGDLLSVVPGAPSADISGVNDSGTAVGNYFVEAEHMSAFVATHTNFTPIVPSGFSDAWASDITQDGRIVVWGYSNSHVVGGIFQDGTLSAVSPLNGDEGAAPMRINFVDALIGLSYDEDTGSSRPAYWASASATPIDLSTAPINASEWSAITISDINDKGVISGWGVTAGEHEFRPFIIRPNSVPEPAILGFLACGALLLLRSARRAQA